MNTLTLKRSTLYSSDPQRMVLFLSTLLEMEGHLEEDGLLFFADLEFLIKKRFDEDSGKLLDSFTFLVDSKEYLEELKARYDFLNYRYGMREADFSPERLLVYDPDGRSWLFYVKK